jgi:hypothetical protein
MPVVLLRLMKDNALDSTLTDRAETLRSVVTHTAYVRRTEDTLRQVTTTLVSTYDVVGGALWGYSSRNLNALLNHICPLRVEVNHSGDVWLPRLVLEGVHIVVIVGVVVEVLIAKTCKRVAKLVNYNRAEILVVSSSKGV